ncbi:MAG: glucose-6-phosphate dehydrogenase [Acidimicrobiia bacterium]|nr:glucose-6-phosphate dehydrogenase [Acidimicrobiia bacterium]
MSFDPASATDVNPLADPDDRPAPPAVFVIFGASGDLTSRKLMPAIERLAVRRLLPPGFAVVGVARTEMTDDDFRERMQELVEKGGGGGPEVRHVWESFVGAFRYVAGDYDSPSTFEKLKQVLEELDSERGTAENRLYYLATPPSTFPTVITALNDHGLSTPSSEHAFCRIVIEKPYGHDLQSALELDNVVHRAFDESQVYRIDHYLGKETVQNVLALRFANAIFEPVWNRRYVDHVQITVAESLGVEHRGSFYEQAGALRDIVQNHVMQVLSMTLMEPPVTFDADGIRDEKVKALKAVEVLTPEKVKTQVVRAQYARGWVGGEEVVGYRDEEGVDPHSTTETYVAMKLKVDNWRWAGVPVYVRTGKRLPKRVTEVAMQFHRVPHLPFSHRQVQDLDPDALVLRIQPDEGITLRFGAKVPGQAFQVRSVSMDFFYGAAFLEETPDAYERLLLDALVGDATLFIRSDEVQRAWRIVDPLLQAWENDDVALAKYEAGTWGPQEADQLMEADGRRWRRP